MEASQLVYFDCGHAALTSHTGELLAVLQMPAHLSHKGIVESLAPNYRNKLSIKACPKSLCSLCSPNQDEQLEQLILAQLKAEGLPTPSKAELQQLIKAAQSPPKG